MSILTDYVRIFHLYLHSHLSGRLKLVETDLFRFHHPRNPPGLTQTSHFSATRQRKEQKSNPPWIGMRWLERRMSKCDSLRKQRARRRKTSAVPQSKSGKLLNRGDELKRNTELSIGGHCLKLRTRNRKLLANVNQ